MHPTKEEVLQRLRDFESGFMMMSGYFNPHKPFYRHAIRMFVKARWPKAVRDCEPLPIKFEDIAEYVSNLTKEIEPLCKTK